MKTPRPYQDIAIERASRQGLLLADQCGLGKTISAIETAKRVQTQIGKPVLIVAPTETVKLQWLRELADQGITEDRIIWLDSKTNARTIELTPDHVILTHYEAVRKHIDTLSSIYFSIVICDEAHRIKNRKAKRTEAIKQIRAYRKLALTGTPTDRNPADVWSILNWLDPEFFSSYWRFFDAHACWKEIKVRGGQKVKTIVSAEPSDPARYARVLRPYVLQRRKEDVRADLPEKIEQYVDLEMSKDQRVTYDTIVAAEDPFVDIGDGLETSVSIVLTKILRLIQVTTDPALLGLSDKPSVKLDWLDSWLEDNPEESVIIFTRFRATAEQLAAKLGDRFKLIVGGKRAKITSDDRFIVGTISAMAEGLDLPHIDNAIFIDIEWSSILMQQAIDRIHRINITNAKNIYYLRCVNTVDVMLHQAISEKWSSKQITEAYLNGRTQTDE